MKKYVRKSRRKWIIDLLWPDGQRTKRVMPSESKADEISTRFQAARVDGTWKELRKKLHAHLDYPDGIPAALAGKNLAIKEFEIPQIPPCVYFLCLGEEIVYVGQSIGLARRIIDHSEDDRKLFDRVFYLHVPKKQLSRIEAKFIAELKPRLNRMAPKNWDKNLK